jgi:hypothetical protein
MCLGRLGSCIPSTYSNMKSLLILFLQIAVAICGLLALAFLILEPQVEGRNANATQFQIYFQDFFLAYVDLASVPFFFAGFTSSRSCCRWSGCSPRRLPRGSPGCRASSGVPPLSLPRSWPACCS